MLTKDVILEYHNLVPFPWSPRKLKKAGFDPTALLLAVGRRLEQCDDKDSPEAKAVLEVLDKLKMLNVGGGD